LNRMLELPQVLGHAVAGDRALVAAAHPPLELRLDPGHGWVQVLPRGA
jgi:hypothetical protein